MINTLANQAIPPVAASKPANAYAMTGLSPANIVPSLRQTVMGIEATSPLQVMPKEYQKQPAVIIRHPRHAPSAVAAEQFLAARALMSPAYQHNTLASKIARISNMHLETPRFRDHVDILA
ncbi:MAG: hypothetical protein HOH48_04305 [Candidatus Puniceispirillum sp.]|jgi:hypothetical protein|uniref:hypothetical protein n=1 Tax=Candidatus Puniceispirillum sp. TaxID=2026719 RepID=UPI001EC6CD59|nr:hypothetical protein [Candidatus Puniceispirillum sp.]MBT6414780.1 hypothetical protein [Candidatus Puniceispirillum sp.]MBT6565387.1 hypothetical protein [Candidatus Puniceispirillum sp.]